jgi:hypothetical protein
MFDFIKKSWEEYLSFYKKSFKDKKRRKWLVVLILIIEITIFLSASYTGYKYFFNETKKEIKHG